LADEKKVKAGQSKIGGLPDLPKHISWPVENRTIITKEKQFFLFNKTTETEALQPLSFIAQINLEEASAHDKDSLLPKSGILYFFYSAEQDGWGFDPADRNKFKIIYHEGTTELIKTDFPESLPEYGRFEPSTITFITEVSLPSGGHEVYEEMDDDDEENFWENVYEEDTVNKILGYADVIQNDMELDCELVTNGLYCGDASGYDDPKAALLEPNAKEWRLLLQIDSLDENNMMWVDSGRLYFWIKENDLKAKNFDKAWFALQCF
jgi:uncharacterized protein YwqG